jgi:NADPH:quinone reductase-like Zn-dependent oxidoreductase
VVLLELDRPMRTHNHPDLLFSVGLFAVQLTHWFGTRVIGTPSARNLDDVRGLGAEAVIDHRVTRFEDTVSALDIVFDTVGGETLERSWACSGPAANWSSSPPPARQPPMHPVGNQQSWTATQLVLVVGLRASVRHTELSLCRGVRR